MGYVSTIKILVVLSVIGVVSGCAVCRDAAPSACVWVGYGLDVKASVDTSYAHKLLVTGNRLCAALDKKDIVFKIVVVSDPSDNAFCLSDGRIFIGEGMAKLFKSDDEIACVLAHEMGHVVLRHEVCSNPGYEAAADRFALRLMGKAGYKPAAAAGFWKRYYERIGWWGGVGSHMEPKARIKFLEECSAEERKTEKRPAL